MIRFAHQGSIGYTQENRAPKCPITLSGNHPNECAKFCGLQNVTG
jgi:hypothetical protein